MLCLGEFIFVDQIGFVEQQYIRGGKLPADRIGEIAVFAALAQRLGVGQYDNAVNDVFGNQSDGLCDGVGEGDAAGFDQDMVRFCVDRLKVAQPRNQIAAVGTAHTTALDVDDVVVLAFD